MSKHDPLSAILTDVIIHHTQHLYKKYNMGKHIWKWDKKQNEVKYILKWNKKQNIIA